MNASQRTDFTWNPIRTARSVAKWNHFAGTGNIAPNSFPSYPTAHRSSDAFGAGVLSEITPSQSDLITIESIAQTYSTDGNASFDFAGEDNDLTLDLGLLAYDASDDESPSIFDLGDLELTGFAGGDDPVDISGGDVAASGFSLDNADVAGQNPLDSTDRERTYDLASTDSVGGLSPFASTSIDTNSLDLTTLDSVAPAVKASLPEPSTFLVWSGLGAIGLVMAWRRRTRAA